MPNITGVFLSEDESGIQVHIPMKMKRRGGRKEIIVPQSLQSVMPSRPVYQEALVIALARGHRWKEMLESGKYGSVTELATAIGADRSYVARLLRFTLLAPDIVEAILDGREPSGFPIGKLIGRMPASWEEQREKYGFRKAHEIRPLRTFHTSRCASEHS